MSTIRTLLVSKGHAYDHDAFLAMFADMPDVDVTLVEQPAAAVLLQPQHLADYDAVLFYDMSGIGPRSRPDAAYDASMRALLERGVGVVALNHALVSWPGWPLWRAITGTSFMLTAGTVFGAHVPGSGYRGGAHGPLPNATTRVTPVVDGHPVVAGLEDGFTVTDELYLKTDSYERHVLPLLRSDYSFIRANFSPPPLAPAAEQTAWDHPPGSTVVVWANAAGNSPVVASDLGDTPEAFGSAGFRRLLHNALRWVASHEARDWARGWRTERTLPA